MLVLVSRSMRFGFCSWVLVACLLSDAESTKDYQDFVLHQNVFLSISVYLASLMLNAVCMYIIAG